MIPPLRKRKISSGSSRRSPAPVLAAICALAVVAPVASASPQAPGTISFIDLPTWAQPMGIVAGSDGNLWVAELPDSAVAGAPAVPQIARVTPGGTVTHFPVTGATQLDSVTKGADGNVWFTLATASGGSIGRITPAGVITTYDVGDVPRRIISGPDGALWFTVGSNYGRIAPGDASPTTHSARKDGSETPVFNDLAFTADGKLWLQDSIYGKKALRRLTLGVNRAPQSIEIFSSTDGFNTSRIVTGPDGRIWFTRSYDHAVGAIASDGTVTNLPLGVAWGGTSEPTGISVGSDGKLWVADSNSLYSVTTARRYMQFGGPYGGASAILSRPNPGGWPFGPTIRNVTPTADGRVWFSDFGARRIGSIGSGRDTWNLTVNLTGAGTGTLALDGSGTVCSKTSAAAKSCTVAVQPSVTSTFSAGAGGSAGSLSWTGGCVGTPSNASCSQTILGDGNSIGVQFDLLAALSSSPTAAAVPRRNTASLKLSITASAAGKATVSVMKCASSSCLASEPWADPAVIALSKGKKTYSVAVPPLVKGTFQVRVAAKTTKTLKFSVS